jgi:cytosine/adenosine deaminase-related metal-dependent hydrolase
MQESGTLLLRGGQIVSMDPVVGNLTGSVLVRDGRIAAVGEGDLGAGPGVPVLDATGMIVMPGMVDTHRHTWQTCVRHRNGDRHGQAYFAEMLDTIGPEYQPDDVYIGTLLGALSAIDAGVTTIYDWAHIQNTPSHADAGIRALSEANLRAVFGHGRSLANPGERAVQRNEVHSSDIRRLKREYFSDHSLVTLAMSARGPEATEGEVWRADLDLARELGIMSSIHVGIADLGPRYRAVARMHEAGELGDDLIFVHGNSCSDEEIGFIAEAGAGVSIGAQVEMTSQGSGPIPTDRFLAAGVWPSLSGDSETMGTGDMFTQMRIALCEYRLKAGTGQAAPGAPATLTTADALGMATVVGAETLGLGQTTGSISPGKAADIVMLDADSINLAPVSDPVGAIVLAAHPGNVDTVLVEGRVLKRHGELVGVDLDRIRAMARESNLRHPPLGSRLPA